MREVEVDSLRYLKTRSVPKHWMKTRQKVMKREASGQDLLQVEPADQMDWVSQRAGIAERFD